MDVYFPLRVRMGRLMVKLATFRAWITSKRKNLKLLVTMESGVLVQFSVASVRYEGNLLICTNYLGPNEKCEGDSKRDF